MRHHPRLGTVLLLSTACILMGAFAASAWAPDGSANFVSPLSGEDEVPPRDTKAVGIAVFHLSKDETELDYRLNVARIDNVVAAHIHLGATGVNGPVVAFLYGAVPPGGGRANGVLAIGTVTAKDLVGPLTGQPLSALVDAMRSGGTYVNVHTNDGEGPVNTGPGDFPGGEIRGQIAEGGPTQSSVDAAHEPGCGAVGTVAK